ncbi:hypothetical protein HGA91_04505 [candidate division WWE3 bacterium]|nr:hypothetical protein [candidate division WWE3 bacterium]
MKQRSTRFAAIMAALMALMAIFTFASAALSGTNLPISGQLAQKATAIAAANTYAQGGHEIAKETPITITEPVPAKPADNTPSVQSIEPTCQVGLMLRLFRDRHVELEVTSISDCQDTDEVSGTIWVVKSATGNEFARTPITFKPATVSVGYKPFSQKLNRLSDGDVVHLSLAINGEQLVNMTSTLMDAWPVFGELRPGPGPDVCLVLNGEVDPHGFLAVSGNTDELHKELNTDTWTWEILKSQLPDVAVWSEITFTAFDTLTKGGKRAEYHWYNVHNPCFTPATATATATNTPTPTNTPTATTVTLTDNATADANCTELFGKVRNGTLTGNVTSNGDIVATVNETAGDEERDYHTPFTTALNSTHHIEWNLTFSPLQGNARQVVGQKDLVCGGTPTETSTPTNTPTPTRTSTPNQGSGKITATCKVYGATIEQGVSLTGTVTATDATGTITATLSLNTSSGVVSLPWERTLVGMTSFSWTGTVTGDDGIARDISGSGSEDCGGSTELTPTPSATPEVVRQDPRLDVALCSDCYNRYFWPYNVQNGQLDWAVPVNKDGNIAKWYVIEIIGGSMHCNPESGPSFSADFAFKYIDADGNPSETPVYNVPLRNEHQVIVIPRAFSEAGFDVKVTYTQRHPKNHDIIVDTRVVDRGVPGYSAEQAKACVAKGGDCQGLYVHMTKPLAWWDTVNRELINGSEATVNLLKPTGFHPQLTLGWGGFQKYPELGEFPGLVAGTPTFATWYNTTDTTWYQGEGDYSFFSGRAAGMSLPTGQFNPGVCSPSTTTTTDTVEVCKSIDWSTGEMTTISIPKEELDTYVTPDACQPPAPKDGPKTAPRALEVCAYLDTDGKRVNVPADQLSQVLRDHGLDSPACTAGDAGMIDLSLLWLLVVFPGLLACIPVFLHLRRRGWFSVRKRTV